MGFIALIGLILFLLKDKIDRKLHPEHWILEEILGKENYVYRFYVKKSKDLQFEFNNGIYNLFEAKSKTDSAGNTQIEKTLTTIYREGPFIKIYHVEGHKDPLDFRNQEVTQDAQHTKALSKAEIANFLNAESKMSADRIILYIIAGIGLLIVIFLIAKK